MALVLVGAASDMTRKKAVKDFLVYDGEYSYTLQLVDKIVDERTGRHYGGTVIPPKGKSKFGKILLDATQPEFDFANSFWHETIHLAEMAEQDLSLTDDEVLLIGRYLARLFRNSPEYGEMLLAASKRP